MIIVAPARKGGASLIARQRIRPEGRGGPFIGIKLAAGGRVDAIGGDQAGPGHRQRRAILRLEMGAHAVRVLVPPGQRMPKPQPFGTEAGQRGLVEQELEPPAMDRVLGIGVVGGDAARLGPDQLPEFVVVAQFGGAHGDCFQGVA